MRTLQAAYFGLLCASLIVQCPPTSAFRFSFPYRVAVGAVCRGVVLCCLASLDNPAKRDRKSTRLNLQSPDHLVCRLLLEKKKQVSAESQAVRKARYNGEHIFHVVSDFYANDIIGCVNAHRALMKSLHRPLTANGGSTGDCQRARQSLRNFAI